MIQASELRIGNLVASDMYKRNFRVKSISTTAIEQDDSDYTQYLAYGKIKGIPLTPGILEKARFRNSQGDYWIKDNDLMIALDSVWWCTNSWKSDGEFGYEALATWREITYLHQLQNLYFALTQTELNINL